MSVLNGQKLLVGSLLFLFAAVGCASSQAEPVLEEIQEPDTSVTLTISGSGGTTLILSAIKAEFENDNPGYQLEILTGTGTGGGVQGVTEKVLDVAAMARPPKDTEIEAAPDLQYLGFGYSAQAFYTSLDVDVTTLTSEQVDGIFLGDITNWSEVGGQDLKIFVYVRDEGDSSTSAFREGIFGDAPFWDEAQVMTSQGDMIAAVEGTPGSIGFGTWSAVKAAGANVKAIALDGIAPADSAYPITGALGIGYLGENAEIVQPLIDWLTSDRGLAALQGLDVIILP